jgi:catechol 2,3-dioxygenase-like lactoylglutathione lyase family enzyme
MAQEFVAKVAAENNHVCVTVRDFGVALGFYHDLIGLPVVRRMGTDEEPTSYWLPGIQLRLRAGDTNDQSAGALDHIGIGVENIAEVCARLDAAGYQPEQPLGERTLPGITRHVMNVFYRDPDGNRVEFVHWI